MATTSVRRAAMAALLAAIEAADEAVQEAADDPAPALLVDSGWPGDTNDRARMLWVDDVSSVEDIPVMTGARMHRDDKFRISLLIRSTGCRSNDDAHAELEAIDALIDDVLADDHTLDDLDGVVSVAVTEGNFTVGTTTGGVVGYGQRTVEIHARLT